MANNDSENSEKFGKRATVENQHFMVDFPSENWYAIFEEDVKNIISYNAAKYA